MSAADCVAVEGEEFSLSGEESEQCGNVVGEERLLREVADTGDSDAGDDVLCPPPWTGRSTLRCGVDMMLMLLLTQRANAELQ